MRQSLDDRKGHILVKRRVLWLLVIMVFLTALAVGMWPYLPREVDVRLEGVKYRLGPDHASVAESAIIYIKGSTRQTLQGHRQFQGTVELKGESFPVPKEQMKNRTFIAHKGESFLLAYQWYEDGFKNFTLGELYTDDDFRHITMTLLEQGEDGQPAWSSGDGWMISAPAKDRTEAIQLANKLMSRVLSGQLPMN